MDARDAQRIEGIANLGAAAILAAAVAYAVSRFAASTAVVGAAAVAALFGALQVLRSIAPRDSEFSLAQFEPAELAFEDWDELLLTEADRLDPGQPPAADGELVLDDVLAKLGEESRVVALFDSNAMPTPGQLSARIEWHLNQTDSPGASPDAADALHQALAELRRSLK